MNKLNNQFKMVRISTGKEVKFAMIRKCSDALGEHYHVSMPFGEKYVVIDMNTLEQTNHSTGAKYRLEMVG